MRERHRDRQREREGECVYKAEDKSSADSALVSNDTGFVALWRQKICWSYVGIVCSFEAGLFELRRLPLHTFPQTTS